MTLQEFWANWETLAEEVGTESTETHKIEPVTRPNLSSLTKYQTTSPKRLEALLSAKSFCEDVCSGKTGKTLVLSGLSGVGKTFLSRLILEAIRLPGSGSRDWGLIVGRHGCVTMTSLSAAIKKDEQLKNDHIGRIMEDPVLILDDVCADIPGGFRRDDYLAQLFRIVDYRVERGLFTVISTNLTKSGIEQMDGRIASRLKRLPGSAIIEIDDCGDFNQ